MKTLGAQEVIMELARRTQRPVEEVQHVYQQHLDQLEAYARVKIFLPLLVKRRAWETLRRH